MKDKEARQQIKGVQSHADKIKGLLSQEIKRVESKDDKGRANLIARVEALEEVLGVTGHHFWDSGWDFESDYKALWKRFLEVERGWESKFTKTKAHWVERKESKDK